MGILQAEAHRDSQHFTHSFDISLLWDPHAPRVFLPAAKAQREQYQARRQCRQSLRPHGPEAAGEQRVIGTLFRR